MKRKLIEVALPLEAINRESAREKSIRHGHPSTLHLWWARRPLAACRAVLFASLVDDPSSLPEEFPTEEAQEKERQRLFRIIEDLVKWENSNNETVLEAARKEILRSTDGNPPPVLDPFCGGGSIPLEAQRLGLEAHGSDLNPVAVLITKALIDIPPRFADGRPVNPESGKKLMHSAKWKGARGLADDVRYYVKWMRQEAEKRIGHLYPKVTLEDGGDATAIAWLWARTVKSPNPAFSNVAVPLASSFMLATKPGKEVYVEPVIDGDRYHFTIKTGTPRDTNSTKNGTKVGRGGHFRCLLSGAPIPVEYIRSEGLRGEMGTRLMAVVAEGPKGRVYRAPDATAETPARMAEPSWRPDYDINYNPRDIRTQLYGLTRLADLFTPRQLVALTTFSDLVGEARDMALADAVKVMPADPTALADGGVGANAYADAIATYLAFAVSRMTDYNCTLATWASNPQMEIIRNAFARQAMPMTWDFAEANPFGPSSGSLDILSQPIIRVLEALPTAASAGTVAQLDATTSVRSKHDFVFSTDPPYYDNIGYADLSDFFYVWLRRALRDVYPELLSTLLVPKAQELIASPYRFDGSKNAAKEFFETGLSQVFEAMSSRQDRDFPLTVYYAFKQAESEEETTASTGWETMLEALLAAGFTVDGTWPIRTERSGRMISVGTNALASSIVLVCRTRSATAQIATRKEFIGALKRELPGALKKLQHSSIAAVDLAQATIGPGMAIFSRYAKVVEADGTGMRVRSALQLINQALDEVLSEQESEYDADTQWAVAWFSDNGMDDGPFGSAEVLSKAKNTSIGGLERAGIVAAPKSKVRLISRESLPADWDPSSDARLTVWEVTQQLIRRLQNGGEADAAALLRKVGGLGEVARDLAYRLYAVCERKGWTDEAIAYNSLVVAWPDITKIASESSATTTPEQGSFLR